MTMAEKNERVRPTVSMVNALNKEINGLKEMNLALDKQNEWMDKELESLRSELAQQMTENLDLQRELTYLRNRGFWGRVFNK